jgi:aldose sugar dehydrogenase
MLSTLTARAIAVALIAAAGCNATDPRPAATEPDGPDRPDAEATHDFTVRELVAGLEHPWGMAFLPGGDILVTERPGRVRLIRDGALRGGPVAGAPEAEAGGQGGMLDIVLHPDFDANRWVYISYSKAVQGGRTTAVARARWEGDRLVGTEDIFVAAAVGTTGQHFGSRLVFDRDGYLFVTVGDRGEMARAQNPGDHAGTTLRLHDDGSVPDGNPFVGRDGFRPEIYTYGNRNAQGMALHPETGEVWQNEHGPRGGDEINRIEAGGNYGWPEYRFANHYDGRPIPDYDPEGDVVLPLLDWTPAFAPSGMAFYTGDRFPNWRGSVFNGGLAGQHLRRAVFDGTEHVHTEELLAGRGWRIRDVRDGPDGYLYFLTDGSNGILGRLEPVD